MKKVWINPISRALFSISFESDAPEKEEKRIIVRESLFPDNPTPKHPLRHTINLGLFSVEDLEQIRETIDNFLKNEEE